MSAVTVFVSDLIKVFVSVLVSVSVPVFELTVGCLMRELNKGGWDVRPQYRDAKSGRSGRYICAIFINWY